MQMMPFVDLRAQYQRLKPHIDSAIQRVLDDGRYILGPDVGRIESELAEFCGVKHAVTVASGTDALFIPMLAMEIGRGHAVFVPAFTYTATAEVILLAGAEPVFVDVDPGTFNIDPADLERKIEATQLAGKLTPKAILAVDLFGLPADWSALNGIAGKHELTLISDAAQSFGGMHDNKRVGALAPVTGTSFFPAKPLGCYGDGGAIFTDDAGLAEVMRSIRTHGTGSHKYDVVRVGLNGRLDTLQAAILSVKLSVFAEELDVRERISRVYDDGLRDVVEVPERVPGARSAWAQYTIKTRRRQELQDKLKADGIPTMIYYPKPMHFQAPYAPFGEGPGSIPVSEGLCGQVLSLPMHPYLRDADVMRIVGSIREALGRQG